MEIIVPAAGLSSRFPNMKPKYLLYGFDGTMMLKRSLQPYLNQDGVNITVGILQEHNERFNAAEFIKKELGDRVNVIILPKITQGPADTVMQIIDIAAIDYNRPLFIKDCDSFFTHDLFNEGNYICTSQIDSNSKSSSITNKSFIIQNKDNIVQQVVEKHIVSDTISVGGYKFHAMHVFRDAFSNIYREMKGEIFVSHIIQYCIGNLGHVFLTNSVSDYIDVGTLNEWLKYNNKPTIFCDIDGTIVEAQARWGKNNFKDDPIPLQNNIDVIKRYQQDGSLIVFTTSRPEWAMEDTTRMLYDLGFKNFKLLMGLNISRRILINDYNNTHPYPMALAVNIKRNSINLDDYL